MELISSLRHMLQIKVLLLHPFDVMKHFLVMLHHQARKCSVQLESEFTSKSQNLKYYNMKALQVMFYLINLKQELLKENFNVLSNISCTHWLSNLHKTTCLPLTPWGRSSEDLRVHSCANVHISVLLQSNPLSAVTQRQKQQRI